MKHLRILFLALIAGTFSTLAHSGVETRKYQVEQNLELQYVISSPSSETDGPLEVWIYQDGDGSVRKPFQKWRARLLAKHLTQTYSVGFVWPELRREYFHKDLKQYCDLDYNHRTHDLDRLIDDVRENKPFSSARIFLIGFSAGSEIVTKVANDRKDIAGVLTVGGGVLQLIDYAKIVGEAEELKKLAENKCSPETYEARSGLFWEQLLYSNLFEEIENIDIPYLALIGSKDKITKDSVTQPWAKKLESENPNFEYRVVEGMGHGFGLNVGRWKMVNKWTQSQLK